jgi:hypothetical protein
VFERPTREIVAENWRNSVAVAKDILALRLGKVWREASAPRVRSAATTQEKVPGSPSAASD